MQILKSRHKGNDFYQIYVTKEEMQCKETQEKINKIKKTGSKIAIFQGGEKDYCKIIKEIVMIEVEKIHGV